ncbi:cyclohexanone monooxygenase [Shouchella clausii]|nr:cyclohexanone monooxygenase [Shouchella clausii]
MSSRTMSSTKQASRGSDFDAVVVGAGFSGLYMLHRLREAGLSVRVYEAGEGVGGTWYWNRYPGARCDIESIYYNYTFSEELLHEWTWTSRYADQPEILRYINYVADKFDLRCDIQLGTKVMAAHYDDQTHRWNIQTSNGMKVSAKYFITAVGCLSASNMPNFKGLDSFKGELYHTGHWPHERVDFTGKRVGVIGTGSSGIQSIPIIAEEAKHLTVFQRTPQYSAPAKNHPYEPEYLQKTVENYSAIKKQMCASMHGIPYEFSERSALEDSPEERQQVFEKAWEEGKLFSLLYSYGDVLFNPKANETIADFVRSKIRESVHYPDVAEKLMPTYYYSTKRPIIDSHYFETFNRDNVSLVDVRSVPIEEITLTGIRTEEAMYDLDMIVCATGFDAMTGPLFKMDIHGKSGISLKEKWEEGARLRTYLGIAVADFPNLFMITGPQSPSVIGNMLVSIEQHVEWISDCIGYLRQNQIEAFEATVEAEEGWSKHCEVIADSTLFTKTDSWWMGANIEGKPRGFLAYLGGVGNYRQICDRIAAKDYEGFSMIPTYNEEKI